MKLLDTKNKLETADHQIKELQQVLLELVILISLVGS